jgi:hypothetical protein
MQADADPHAPDPSVSPETAKPIAAAADRDAGSLLEQFGRLREEVMHLISANADLVRLHVRNAIIKIVLIALTSAVAMVVVIAAAVLLVQGAAGAVSAAAGASAWVGQLAIGAIGLLGLTAFVAAAVWRARENSRRKRVDKYERLRAKRRARLAGRADAKIRHAA